ncbi:unnamed protein product [Pleuronectes platessa]|uniref:Uncharacterized protein n=1 Tax=Pleuronectes platessa TaxID=8262 RepID=A0A9N7TMB5_PLEPL|nr:unnamed protein product [Pleuronectes platessa]
MGLQAVSRNYRVFHISRRVDVSPFALHHTWDVKKHQPTGTCTASTLQMERLIAQRSVGCRETRGRSGPTSAAFDERGEVRGIRGSPSRGSTLPPPTTTTTTTTTNNSHSHSPSAGPALCSPPNRR